MRLAFKSPRRSLRPTGAYRVSILADDPTDRTEPFYLSVAPRQALPDQMRQQSHGWSQSAHLGFSRVLGNSLGTVHGQENSAGAVRNRERYCIRMAPEGITVKTVLIDCWDRFAPNPPEGIYRI